MGVPHEFQQLKGQGKQPTKKRKKKLLKKDRNDNEIFGSEGGRQGNIWGGMGPKK